MPLPKKKLPSFDDIEEDNKSSYKRKIAEREDSTIESESLAKDFLDDVNSNLEAHELEREEELDDDAINSYSHSNYDKEDGNNIDDDDDDEYEEEDPDEGEEEDEDEDEDEDDDEEEEGDREDYRANRNKKAFKRKKSSNLLSNCRIGEIIRPYQKYFIIGISAIAIIAIIVGCITWFINKKKKADPLSQEITSRLEDDGTLVADVTPSDDKEKIVQVLYKDNDTLVLCESDYTEFQKDKKKTVELNCNIEYGDRKTYKVLMTNFRDRSDTEIQNEDVK